MTTFRSLQIKLVAAITFCALLAAAPPHAMGFGSLPPGYRSLYSYSGVRTIASSVSALIICTNLESVNANVYYEFANYDGTVVGFDDYLIGPGATYTVTASGDPFTAAVAFTQNDANLVLSQDLNMGSVRISSVQKKVICDLQVMDKNGNPPSFVYSPRQYTGGAKR